MATQSTTVFVSYSHADASLVAPVVKLLRVNKSLIFQDIDDIQPGKKWRSEIGKGLAESHLVVVFWCQHASRSEEVSNEWKAAIQQQKDLLPLLLDATPLPTELNDFQWIDFRGMVGRDHGSIVTPDITANATSTPLPDRKSMRWAPLAGIAVVLLAALTLVPLWYVASPAVPPPTTIGTADVAAPPTSGDAHGNSDVPRRPAYLPRPLPEGNPPIIAEVAPGEEKNRPPVRESLGSGDYIATAFAILALLAGLAWWLRQRWMGRKLTAGAAVVRRIAVEIESEILRRAERDAEEGTTP